MQPDDYSELPPDMPHYHAHASPLWHSLPYYASVLFWIWMAYDCYKRHGGLASWHYFFFFFPPSVVIYFVAHIGVILRSPLGGGRGIFGASLKSRIARAQRQLRISDTVAVRAELGELYHDNGQFDESEKEFQKVLEFDPQSNEAHYYIGLCRMQRGDFPGALTFLQRVMDRDKKLRFGLAWLRYTDCLIATGKRDEALEERRKLCRSFPRPLTEFAYAELLAGNGQKDKAREILDEMLATSHQAPREDQVWLKKGKTLLREVA
jgi:tetratricopeptide (TPR) repeat protein